MDKRLLCVLQGVPIYQYEDLSISYRSDLDVDADGANGQAGEWAYKPGNKGLEDLANAGYPQHPEWFKDILVCDLRNGVYTPRLINGGYVSKTAYERSGELDPQKRYLDAFSIPYLVASPAIRKACKGVLLGCRATLEDTVTGLMTECVCGDIGPLRKIGEGSMAALKKLGLPWNPRTGGISSMTRMKTTFYPGTPAVLPGEKFDLIRA